MTDTSNETTPNPSTAAARDPLEAVLGNNGPQINQQGDGRIRNSWKDFRMRDLPPTWIDQRRPFQVHIRLGRIGQDALNKMVLWYRANMQHYDPRTPQYTPEERNEIAEAGMNINLQDLVPRVMIIPLAPRFATKEEAERFAGMVLDYFEDTCEVDVIKSGTPALIPPPLKDRITRGEANAFIERFNRARRADNVAQQRAIAKLHEEQEEMRKRPKLSDEEVRRQAAAVEPMGRRAFGQNRDRTNEGAKVVETLEDGTKVYDESEVQKREFFERIARSNVDTTTKPAFMNPAPGSSDPPASPAPVSSAAPLDMDNPDLKPQTTQRNNRFGGASTDDPLAQLSDAQRAGLNMDDPDLQPLASRRGQRFNAAQTQAAADAVRQREAMRTGNGRDPLEFTESALAQAQRLAQLPVAHLPSNLADARRTLPYDDFVKHLAYTIERKRASDWVKANNKSEGGNETPDTVTAGTLETQIYDIERRRAATEAKRKQLEDIQHNWSQEDIDAEMRRRKRKEEQARQRAEADRRQAEIEEARAEEIEAKRRAIKERQRWLPPVEVTDAIEQERRNANPVAPDARFDAFYAQFDGEINNIADEVDALLDVHDNGDGTASDGPVGDELV